MLVTLPKASVNLLLNLVVGWILYCYCILFQQIVFQGMKRKVDIYPREHNITVLIFLILFEASFICCAFFISFYFFSLLCDFYGLDKVL